MNLAHRTDSYPVEMFSQVPTFVTAPAVPSSPALRQHVVRRGARIFDASAPFARTYTVASGEVLVHRNGELIDIVEAGELLDPRIWGDATAVAHTDCTLTAPGRRRLAAPPIGRRLLGAHIRPDAPSLSERACPAVAIRGHAGKAYGSVARAAPILGVRPVRVGR